MTRFVTADTDPIDIGEGDTVHIRRRMSYGQQRALSVLLTDKDPRAGLSEYLVAILQQNIVRWEGPGFDAGGTPKVISRESLDELDPSIANRLLDEINQRNGGKRDGLDPTPSATSSSPPSPTADTSVASTLSSASASASAGPGTS